MKSKLPAFRGLLFFVLLLSAPLLLAGQNGSDATGKITGTVIDDYNAMTLPMAPLEVVGTETVVYTELDGKYTLELPPGSYEIKVVFPGYEDN